MLSFTPNSKHVKLVSYDPTLKHLAVTFATTGKTYTHVNVPQEIYTRASKLRSFGQYYHGAIKTRYKLLATE